MLEIVIADKLSKFRLIVNFWTNDPCSGYQKCSKDLRQPPKGLLPYRLHLTMTR